MNDEQKQVVAELRKHGLGNGSMGYHSGWMDETADMIERLAAEIGTLRAQIERIRQSTVTHEAHQMVLDELEKEKANHQHTEECAAEFESEWKRTEKELEQVKRERDAAIMDIGLMVENDAETCDVCAHYRPNTEDCDCEIMTYVDDDIKGDCCFSWRGPCDCEWGGKSE